VGFFVKFQKDTCIFIYCVPYGATFQKTMLSGNKYHCMRQIIFILGLSLFISCKKDTISVSGLYTENTPVAGRSQLNFISNNVLVKIETGSNYKDSFRYSISPGKILLTPIGTTQYSGQEFDFEKIDDNTVKIENLYPSIPESAKSYMIFKK